MYRHEHRRPWNPVCTPTIILWWYPIGIHVCVILWKPFFQRIHDMKFIWCKKATAETSDPALLHELPSETRSAPFAGHLGRSMSLALHRGQGHKSRVKVRRLGNRDWFKGFFFFRKISGGCGCVLQNCMVFCRTASIYVSIYLSIYLSFCMYIYIYIYIYIHIDILSYFQVWNSRTKLLADFFDHGAGHWVIPKAS